jgi:excisionase family DNA binding protein
LEGKLVYLTKQEVADVLRVSVRTVTTYMKNNVLPEPRKLGGKLLWDEDELHRRIKFSAPSEGLPELQRAKRGRPRKVKFA